MQEHWDEPGEHQVATISGLSRDKISGRGVHESNEANAPEGLRHDCGQQIQPGGTYQHLQPSATVGAAETEESGLAADGRSIGLSVDDGRLWYPGPLTLGHGRSVRIQARKQAATGFDN